MLKAEPSSRPKKKMLRCKAPCNHLKPNIKSSVLFLPEIPCQLCIPLCIGFQQEEVVLIPSSISEPNIKNKRYA